MLTAHCPHCNADYDGGDFCKKCSKILPFITDNPFEILGIHVTFDIDKNSVNESLIKRLSIYHPDKFINADNATKEIAMRNSALLNDSAKKLMKDTERAEAILSLHDECYQDSDRDTSYVNSELMQEYFDVQESIESAISVTACQELDDAISDKLAENYKELTHAFRHEKFALANQSLIERKFLLRLRVNIDQKKEQLI